MQTIKPKMMVGDLVVVPDRVFMGVRDIGGVARIIRVERYNARKANQDINKPVSFDAKEPKELITTVEMVDGKQRQYYLKDVKPA
jgi:NMD protein affecting ribosome stability and mRNA decay